MTPHVRFIGPSVYHNFLQERDVPCCYRSTCFSEPLFVIFVLFHSTLRLLTKLAQILEEGNIRVSRIIENSIIDNYSRKVIGAVSIVDLFKSIRGFFRIRIRLISSINRNYARLVSNRGNSRQYVKLLFFFFLPMLMTTLFTA